MNYKKIPNASPGGVSGLEAFLCGRHDQVDIDAYNRNLESWPEAHERWKKSSPIVKTPRITWPEYHKIAWSSRVVKAPSQDQWGAVGHDDAIIGANAGPAERLAYREKLKNRPACKSKTPRRRKVSTTKSKDTAESLSQFELWSVSSVRYHDNDRRLATEAEKQDRANRRQANRLFRRFDFSRVQMAVNNFMRGRRDGRNRDDYLNVGTRALFDGIARLKAKRGSGETLPRSVRAYLTTSIRNAVSDYAIEQETLCKKSKGFNKVGLLRLHQVHVDRLYPLTGVTRAQADLKYFAPHLLLLRAEEQQSLFIQPDPIPSSPPLLYADRQEKLNLQPDPIPSWRLLWLAEKRKLFNSQPEWLQAFCKMSRVTEPDMTDYDPARLLGRAGCGVLSRRQERGFQRARLKLEQHKFVAKADYTVDACGHSPQAISDEFDAYLACCNTIQQLAIAMHLQAARVSCRGSGISQIASQIGIKYREANDDYNAIQSRYDEHIKTLREGRQPTKLGLIRCQSDKSFAREAARYGLKIIQPAAPQLIADADAPPVADLSPAGLGRLSATAYRVVAMTNPFATQTVDYCAWEAAREQANRLRRIEFMEQRKELPRCQCGRVPKAMSLPLEPGIGRVGEVQYAGTGNLCDECFCDPPVLAYVNVMVGESHARYRVGIAKPKPRTVCRVDNAEQHRPIRHKQQPPRAVNQPASPAWIEEVYQGTLPTQTP